MPLTDADRHALDRARHYMRLAREALPSGGRGHMVSLLNSFVRSIDDEIGPEEATGDADSSDGWHGQQLPAPGDGLSIRRMTEHLRAGPSFTEAELRAGATDHPVEAAIRRIANDPGLPGWDDHEREC